MSRFTVDDLPVFREGIEAYTENRDYFMARARARRDWLRNSGESEPEYAPHERQVTNPWTVKQCVLAARDYNRLVVVCRSVIRQLEALT
jgi:hypothetical protein